GLLLDPFGGERDLRAGVLRHVGPAFGEDPLRVLRAMQFAGRFDLTIAPETAAVCREQDLAELPRERLWEEFKKLLLLAPNPSRGLLWAGPLGILPTFPELEALAAVPAGRGSVSPWERTLAVVDAAAQLRGGDAQADAVLMFAALCHNFPPPGGGAARPAGTGQGGAAADEAAKKGAGLVSAARNFLERLTNEHRIAAGVTALLRELFQPEAIHARRGEASAADAQIRWLATRAPVAEVERLARALFVGSAAAAGRPRGPFAAGDWLLQRAAALGVLQGPPQPLLTGHHVKQLGLVEGPALGDLLKQAFARQMAGQISTLAEAQGWAQARLAELAGSAGGGPAETDPAETDPRGPDPPKRAR
ncbi:MAG: hypothetical protein V3S29_03945, partial [bacterium]